MTSAFRDYYNVIIPPLARGITPALKAGIGIGMGGNRRVELLEKIFN